MSLGALNLGLEASHLNAVINRLAPLSAKALFSAPGLLQGTAAWQIRTVTCGCYAP